MQLQQGSVWCLLWPGEHFVELLLHVKATVPCAKAIGSFRTTQQSVTSVVAGRDSPLGPHTEVLSFHASCRGEGIFMLFWAEATFRLCLRQVLNPVLPSHGAVASCVARNKRNRHSQGASVGPGLWRIGKAETQYIHKEGGQMGLAGACAWIQRACSGWSKGQSGLSQAQNSV